MDPSGHSVTAVLIAPAFGTVIGAAMGAGFEIYAQIRSNGWDPAAWDVKAICMAALGGAVSGFITALPVPTFAKLGVWGKFLSYGFTFAYGAAGALACGNITGAIDFHSSSEIITGVFVGGFANVAARGISDLILSRQTSQIMKMPRKAKSLTIQRIQGEMGVPGALKGGMRNAYKNYTSAQVGQLLFESNPWIKYGIYSSINSAWMSSLPYAF